MPHRGVRRAGGRAQAGVDHVVPVVAVGRLGDVAVPVRHVRRAVQLASSRAAASLIGSMSMPTTEPARTNAARVRVTSPPPQPASRQRASGGICSRRKSSPCSPREHRRGRAGAHARHGRPRSRRSSGSRAGVRRRRPPWFISFGTNTCSLCLRGQVARTNDGEVRWNPGLTCPKVP